MSRAPNIPTLALSAKEAAAALGISRATFDAHVRDSVTWVILGPRIRKVPVSELEGWLTKRSVRLSDVDWGDEG